MAVQSYHIIWDTPISLNTLLHFIWRVDQPYIVMGGRRVLVIPQLQVLRPLPLGAVVTTLEIRFSWLPLSNIFLPSLVLVFLPLGDETYQTSRAGEVWQEATTFTICQDSRSHSGQICYNTLAPSRAHTKIKTSDKCCRQFDFYRDEVRAFLLYFTINYCERRDKFLKFMSLDKLS